MRENRRSDLLGNPPKQEFKIFPEIFDIYNWSPGLNLDPTTVPEFDVKNLKTLKDRKFKNETPDFDWIHCYEHNFKNVEKTPKNSMLDRFLESIHADMKL